MKDEIKWIMIWILAITVLTMLELTYMYLNNELTYYIKESIILFLITTVIPYTIWKVESNKKTKENNTELLFINSI
jgi:hypothetical protein